MTVIIRNKNAILELIKSGGLDELHILQGLAPDEKTEEILRAAKHAELQIFFDSKDKMPTRRSGRTQEVIYAKTTIRNVLDFDTLLDELYAKDETPFFLLLNKVDIDYNIAVLARLAYASSVNGLFFDDEVRHIINDETVHISLGAILRVPVVKMRSYEAVSRLKKEGIKTFALDMSGKAFYDADLTGPSAFLLGAEKSGLSKELMSKADDILSLPMKHGIDSLNVTSSTAPILYEKLRQESKASGKFNGIKL